MAFKNKIKIKTFSVPFDFISPFYAIKSLAEWKLAGNVSFTSCARIHIRKTGRNFFFTITDLENRIVSVLSLGQVAPSRNKRVKNSPLSFDKIAFRIAAALKKVAVDAVVLLIRSNFRWQLRNFQRLLLLSGIQIAGIDNRILSGHGSLRPPKKPRK